MRRMSLRISRGDQPARRNQSHLERHSEPTHSICAAGDPAPSEPVGKNLWKSRAALRVGIHCAGHAAAMGQRRAAGRPRSIFILFPLRGAYCASVADGLLISGGAIRRTLRASALGRTEILTGISGQEPSCPACGLCFRREPVRPLRRGCAHSARVRLH